MQCSSFVSAYSPRVPYLLVVQFLLETVRLGLSNLRRHALRSILTCLGIILGVAAVIVVVAIGEGNKRAALRDIAALGARNIIVRSSKPPDVASTSQARTFLSRYGLMNEDARRLTAGLDGLVIVPLKAVGSEISRDAFRTTAQCFGTVAELAQVANLQTQPGGRYLSDQDVVTHAPVAVLGDEIARQMFPARDAIGKDFRIDQQVFRVVGVLQPQGLSGGAGSALVGRDLNRDIHVPMTTAERQFGDIVQRRSSGSFSAEEVQLSEVYVTAPSTESVGEVAARVERVIEIGHPDMTDVQIVVPWELLENARRAMVVWNIMLVSIAAISLLVGGIGIMNIMLASVTERTREIGIRRALGATRRHIVLQFLVETGSLSAVGGVIGILLGIMVAIGLGQLVELIRSLPMLRGAFGRVSLEPVITLWSIFVSFGVAAAVGLVFGTYPALVASRKDPVVALRQT